MTKKEAKEELMQYRWDMEYINEKNEKISELRNKVDRMTVNLQNRVKSSSTDIKEKMLCQIADLDSEVADLIEKANQKRQMIEDKLSYLHQPYRNVLYNYYVLGMSNNSIAEKNSYTVQRIYQILNKGVTLYSEVG